MPKLKLTYFDFDGGRGEVARLALSVGGVPFEDNRVPPQTFRDMKPTLPFGSLPTLEIDGVVLAQSNAINRYVGKLAGLYPEDAVQAAFCDEAMDAIEDLASKVAPTIMMPAGEERTRLRKELAAGPIPTFLGALAKRLEARGGTWFADNRLTVADLKVYLQVRHLQAGVLDDIPKDIVAQHAPALVAHFERVRDHAGVQKYYAARPKK